MIMKINIMNYESNFKNKKSAKPKNSNKEIKSTEIERNYICY